MPYILQEPEALEPGAGAGQQNVTELDAWLKCSALSALGMPVQEVSCQNIMHDTYAGPLSSPRLALTCLISHASHSPTQHSTTFT